MGIESDVYCTDDIHKQYKDLAGYIYPDSDYYIVFTDIRVVNSQQQISSDLFSIMHNIPKESKTICILGEPIDFNSINQTIKNRTNYFKLVIERGIYDYVATRHFSLKQELDEQGLKTDGIISFGYSEVLEESFYHNIEKNINIHFCGDMYSFQHENRRHNAISQIENNGLSINCDLNMWLEDCCKKVSQSKIELNIHGWSSEELKRSYELARMVNAIMQKTLVVSEPIYNPCPYEDGEHLVFCDLNDMPNVCKYYLENDEERTKIVNSAFDFWKNKCRMDDYLYNFIVNNIDEHFEKKCLIEVEFPKILL